MDSTGTHGDLIARLTAEGFEADWNCLGGDWWGVCVVDDVSTVIITGGDGGHQAKRDDLLENCGMGFHHEGDWVADMPEAPTDWAEFVSVIRAWMITGSLPEGCEFGCSKCGTTDTGRFTDGAKVCIDCLDQYDADRERASLVEEADDRASWEDVGCHICGQSMTYFDEGNRVCPEAPGSFCRRA